MVKTPPTILVLIFKSIMVSFSIILIAFIAKASLLLVSENKEGILSLYVKPFHASQNGSNWEVASTDNLIIVSSDLPLGSVILNLIASLI